MLNKAKKFTCLLMIAVLMLVAFTPSAVSAAEAKRTDDAVAELTKASDPTLFSARGNELSETLHNELTAYNIDIKADTSVEIRSTGDGNGSVLVATNSEGSLITQSFLMAVDEDGELETFSEDDIVAASGDLSGDSATLYPFNNSFKIVFMVSYYAYEYAPFDEGIIQPQTAMVIYYDNNNLYNITSLSMTYNCYGIEGYFDGTTFTPISGPLDGYRYSMSLRRSAPNKNTYYSVNNPISSNKAVQIGYEPGGVQEIVYTLVGTSSSGSSINITREVDL